MFKALARPVLAAASFLLALSPFAASAQGNFPAFTMVSQASGNCLTLKAPDQSDGGGLITAPCQNFPNFFVTVAGSVGEVQLQFRLTSSHFVCVFADDNPVVSPNGQRPKVGTRNCVSPSGLGPKASMWSVRGPDNDGFQQIEKLANNIDSSGFCMIETPTADIELEVCQGVNTEHWKLNRVP